MNATQMKEIAMLASIDYDATDPQKTNLYVFEDEYLHKHGCMGNTLTLEECNLMIEGLYKRMNIFNSVQIPVVKHHSEQVKKLWISTEDDNVVVIRVPEDTEIYILEIVHEIAHHLTDVEMQVINKISNQMKVKPVDYEDHGPEFLCTYIHLLTTHFEIDQVHILSDVFNYNQINTENTITFSDPNCCFWSIWEAKNC